MDALEKWMIIRFTPTKPPPPKEGCSSKKCLQIILAAKWLVWHLSTFPNQQRRPLPSLFSDSHSMVPDDLTDTRVSTDICYT